MIIEGRQSQLRCECAQKQVIWNALENGLQFVALDTTNPSYTCLCRAPSAFLQIQSTLSHRETIGEHLDHFCWTSNGCAASVQNHTILVGSVSSASRP